MSREDRLSLDEARAVTQRAIPIPAHRGASPVAVQDIIGTAIDGSARRVGLTSRASSVLLLFLSSTCDGCRDLFAAARDPRRLGLTRSGEVLVVLRAGDDAAAELVGETPAVRSDDAWRDYQVTGPPFFTYVMADRSTVATEGVAWGDASIADAVRAAEAGDLRSEMTRLRPEEQP